MSLQRAVIRLAKRLIEEFKSELRTHIPCQVISYDSAENVVTVQPCVNLIRTDDPNNLSTVSMPVIEDVPVQLIGSGKCLLAVAPQADSYGVLHVSDRALDQWFDKGGIVDPDSARKFDPTDGFFVPGIYPGITDGDNGKLATAVQTDRVELRDRSRNCYLSAVDDGTADVYGTTVNINGTADWAVAYTDLKSAFDTLKTDFNNLVIVMNTHLHSGVTVGLVNTGLTTVAGTSSAADMSSSKVSTVKLP